MSNNVFKSNFIQFTSQNTKVIDGNELAKKHIEQNSNVFKALNPEELPAMDEDAATSEEVGGVDALTADSEEEVSYENELSLDPDDLRAQCDEMLNEANNAAEQIREQARQDAEEIRKKARVEGHDEGFSKGSEEAKATFEKKTQALEEERNRLNEEYRNKILEIEPMLVGAVSDVFRNVFGKGLFVKEDVVCTLLNRALLEIEDDERVAIFVNADDYNDIIKNKDKLLNKVMLSSEPEIHVREGLKSGEAKIETVFGIMDCSIDRELNELNRVLRLLSSEG